MKRTRNRPLPSGRMDTTTAAAVTASSGLASLALLAPLGMEPVTCASAIWLGYAFGYIPLKTRTRFNTHVGSVVGALPVALGWSATATSMVAA
jgi:protoheme IX farnesyltransferase